MESAHRTTAVLETAPPGTPSDRRIESVGRPEPVGSSRVDDPPPGDRIRAARAAADLNREELAELIGSSARTIRRLEDGKRGATPDELRLIAAACRAPEWFLTHGWRGFDR